MRTHDGKWVHYTILSPQNNQTTPLVISPGMGETSLFYTELAFQLSQRGFGPFFIIDHRGNGLSQRDIPDSQTIHMDHFNLLVQDYIEFLHEIVEPFLIQHHISQKPLSLNHSMGAAVGAIALGEQKDLQRFFKSAVFFSPMFKINLRFRLQNPFSTQNQSLIDWDLNFFNQQPISWILTGLKFLAPHYQVMGQGKIPSQFDTQNRITSSEGHWKLRQYLETQLGQPLTVTHVTNSWIKEAIDASEMARQEVPHIHIPTLLIGAQNDQLILNSALYDLSLNNPLKHLEMIQNSKHAIHLENKFARNSLISLIQEMNEKEIPFFQSSNK